MQKLNAFLLFLFTLSAVSAFAQPDIDIPNREAGKCYAKCLIPDEYETYTEEVLVRPASKRIEVVNQTYEPVSEQKLKKEAAKKLSISPAEFETVTERYVSKEASTRIEVVPAVYEKVTEQVLTHEASTRLEIVPAEWETKTEQVLVREAGSRIERVPAKYRTETETIVVSPATTKWVKKKGDRNCLSADPNDCLVWCLVEVPERTKTVTKQVRVGCDQGWEEQGDDCIKKVDIPAEYESRSYRVVSRQAASNTFEVPAEYGTITIQKLKTPATTRVIDIPEEYATRTYKKLVKPATVIENDIAVEYETRSYQKLSTPAAINTFEVPAEYKTITKTRLVKKGGFTEWREVVCGSDITIELVRQVQRALMQRGYELPKFGDDNVLGSETKAALVQYQKDNGLPVGQLDKETLKALEIPGYL